MKLGVALRSPVRGARQTMRSASPSAPRRSVTTLSGSFTGCSMRWSLRTTTLRRRGSPGRRHSSACWTPSSRWHTWRPPAGASDSGSASSSCHTTPPSCSRRRLLPSMSSAGDASTLVSASAGQKTNTTPLGFRTASGASGPMSSSGVCARSGPTTFVEFRGEFYHVPRAKVAPKPVQEPHPPITLGGYGPVMIHRAVTLADGFSGGNVPLDEVRPLVREIRAAAEAAGRDPATLQIVSRGTLRLHDTPQGANRRPNPVDNLSVRSALGAGRNLAQPPARVYRQSCPPPRQMPASSARPTGLRRIGSPLNVVSPQCSL